MFMLRRLTWQLLLLVTCVVSECLYPSPIFRPNVYSNNNLKPLELAFQKIQHHLDRIILDYEFNTSSFSVDVTNSKKTLWKSFHTARDRDDKHPGASPVDGSSTYRIASISKTFTVLGILQQVKAGKMNLDTTIGEYVGGLKGELPWKDITLRTLASQLSGIPRDLSLGDMSKNPEDSIRLGLPAPSGNYVPDCDIFHVPDANKTCLAEDLINGLNRMKPIYPPKQQSTYSNIAFELLGLALSNVTNSTFEDYVRENIFEPFGMKSSSFRLQDKHHAVLPKGESPFWDVNMGAENPTGGIYSSTDDMTKYLRYILGHYNGLTPALNWLQPVSFSGGAGNSFYGTPWEIYTTKKILQTGRQTVFYNKGGGFPGYYSIIMLIPEYDLGVTILTGGDFDLIDNLIKAIVVPLIQGAEEIAQTELERRYAGTYTLSGSNSSITILSDPIRGLAIEDFIFNGTNIFKVLTELKMRYRGPFPPPGFRAQLLPTLLFKDEKSQKGEIWYFNFQEIPDGEPDVWDDSCTFDIDHIFYDGDPLAEVVFWGDRELEELKAVEMSAWKQKFDRENTKGQASENVLLKVQGHQK